jgi:HEAT repeat protein
MLWSALVLAAATALVSPRAFAMTEGTAAPGGGLPALHVRVDLATATVDANGTTVPISLAEARLPAEADVAVESIAIGLGKHVVHVRIPAKDDAAGLAWEAIFAASQPRPIFAGLTGLVDGDPGERTGRAVQVVANGTTSFVVVGDLREDLNLCGQDVTLLDPLALYPASLALRPATVQRLTPARRMGAQSIVATDRGVGMSATLAKLLVARGSSVPGSRGAELTDGDVRTGWVEKRPGAGQGEFVIMAAPKDVPIATMQIIVAPPDALATSGSAPRAFFLLTSTQTFEVTMPEDAWLKPGESYEFAFPQPIETSCVALVLDTAYSRGQAHPDVGIAELVAYSEFDGPRATWIDVARKLSSERGIAAAQVLERAGDGALAAVETAYDELDARGRALAIDVAAAHGRCEEAAPLLARGLCEKQGESSRKAHEKLERCQGAAPALAKSLREVPLTRACVAPTLAAIAPLASLDPIADAIAATPEADEETRAVLRAAFSEGLGAAPPGRLAKLLADGGRSAAARLEIMRAAGARVSEAPAESEATIAQLLGGAPSMRTRYLVLGPLEELARAGERAAAAWVAALAHDADWPVRLRAAQAGAGIPEARTALVAAARDPAPRVREAALESLAVSGWPGAVPAAEALLSEDGWSFVRERAVGVLAKAPASSDVDDALGGALHDRSVGVRGAATVALGLHRAAAYRDAIRERLDDKDEDPEVRAAAAGALGAVCDAHSADRLTELVRSLGIAGTGDEQQQLALGALAGLTALKPSDLRIRLAPLLAADAPPSARTAAQQALSAPSGCR